MSNEIKKTVITRRLDKVVTQQVGKWMLGVGALVLTMVLLLMIALFLYADGKQMQMEVNKASMLLQNERRALAATVRDYASWDDTYAYLQQPNLLYEQLNLSANSLQNMNVSFVVLRTDSGRERFSMLLDTNSKSTMPVSQNREWQTTLADLPEWSTPPRAGVTSTYLRIINGLPALLAVAGVSDTSEQSKPNGILIMGFFLDCNRLAQLNQAAGATLLLSATPKEPTLAIQGVGMQRQQAVQIQGGNHPIWLAVTQHFAWQSQLWLMLSIALGLIVTQTIGGQILRLSLRQLVIRRIETFSGLARQDNSTDPVSWPVQGSDELDDLARAFNRLRERLMLANDALRLQAKTDALTGLGNRRAFAECMTQQKAEYSMLLLDLDGFKQINDELGHDMGDQLLQQVAQRMRQSTRANDQLFRLGGDEFAILLPQTSQTQAQDLAERLLALLQQPVTLATATLTISASIGVASCQLETVHDLMLQADHAMYAAKHGGKARISVYRSQDKPG